MTIAISDLLTPLTKDQVRATMVATLVTLGIPADKWAAGGVASSILTAVATTYAMFSTILASAIGSGFLETATGGWLTLVAHYVYGVDRIVATFATGSVTLLNSGGGSFSFAAGEVTFLNPTTKQTYVNVAPFTLTPSQTKTIDISATTAGAASSSVPLGITTIVTAMLGVTCSNALSVIGQDDELDSTLSTRCLNKLAAMSVRGPRNAYAYAVSVATLGDGSPVNANRSNVVLGDPGNIILYIASPSGAATSDEITACAASVESLVRPQGIVVTVLSVATVAYTPAIVAWCRATPGLNTATIAANAATALASFIADYPIGGVTTSAGRGLFASGVDGVIRGVSPAIVAVTGTTDLPLTATQVATDAAAIVVRVTS